MSRAAPMGGRIFTPRFNVLLALGALACAILLWRFIVGLGPTTGMNDGYPWGIWIAFDVVTGTGIACGGYAMALMVYVFNRGQYHPLVRPALLTTALGYTVAGASVFVDIGRWWNAYKVPSFFMTWKANSALLEVALCVMSYFIVAWIQLSPSFLPSASSAISRRALLILIVFGIPPTMHQSSLGSLMMIAYQAAPALAHPAPPALVPHQLHLHGLRRRDPRIDGVRLGIPAGPGVGTSGRGRPGQSRGASASSSRSASRPGAKRLLRIRRIGSSCCSSPRWRCSRCPPGSSWTSCGSASRASSSPPR